MATTGAPSPRFFGSSVWTGDQLLVWGGAGSGYRPLGDGARYNPRTDVWLPMSSLGAPSPRHRQLTVWIGADMIVWGGNELSGFATHPFGDGARYRPEPLCHFILGFAQLHEALPEILGPCREDERHNPIHGDGLQQTEGGLLVWRKADNFTAFTDGYRTWVHGPFGIQQRLNSLRFVWEANPDGLPLAP